MYASILIPLDGSFYGEKALRHISCHEADARKVTLVGVVHTIEQLYGTRQPDPNDTMEKTEDLLAREAYDDEHGEVRRYLDRTRASLAAQPFEVQVVLAEGVPADEILRVAQEVNADLIAITSMGLTASTSPAKTGIFGKVADSVLKCASAPVLVIKPKPQEPQT